MTQRQHWFCRPSRVMPIFSIACVTHSGAHQFMPLDLPLKNPPGSARAHAVPPFWRRHYHHCLHLRHCRCPSRRQRCYYHCYHPLYFNHCCRSRRQTATSQLRISRPIPVDCASDHLCSFPFFSLFSNSCPSCCTGPNTIAMTCRESLALLICPRHESVRIPSYRARCHSDAHLMHAPSNAATRMLIHVCPSNAQRMIGTSGFDLRGGRCAHVRVRSILSRCLPRGYNLVGRPRSVSVQHSQSDRRLDQHAPSAPKSNQQSALFSRFFFESVYPSRHVLVRLVMPI
jgi:hypothetical protein